MRHLIPLSKRKMPAAGMSLLEKQALTDLIERNLSQIAVFLNIITGLKAQGS